MLRKIKKIIRKILVDILVREILRVYSIAEAFFIFHAIKCTTNNKSVLLIEPNDTHAEILPGFSKYFLELGYSVHVVFRHKMKSEHPFSRIRDKNLFLYGCTYFSTHRIYEYADKRFELVVITTSVVYAEQIYDFLAQHKNLYNTKLGTVAVMHNKNCINSSAMCNMIKESRIISLRDFENTPKTYSIAPIHFGNISQHYKNKKTIFIIVGAIEKNRRDYDLLFSAIRKLIKSGIHNFSVVLAGKNYSLRIPNDISSNIIITGRVNFPILYAHIEKSDFIIPLLNSKINDHVEYITSQVSGSRQIIFGFHKPCIIESTFMKTFDITNKESIEYFDENLYLAMQRAINMTNADYNRMVKKLEMCALHLYTRSKMNLKALLNNISAA